MSSINAKQYYIALSNNIRAVKFICGNFKTYSEIHCMVADYACKKAATSTFPSQVRTYSCEFKVFRPDDWKNLFYDYVIFDDMENKEITLIKPNSHRLCSDFDITYSVHTF